MSQKNGRERERKREKKIISSETERVESESVSGH